MQELEMQGLGTQGLGMQGLGRQGPSHYEQMAAGLAITPILRPGCRLQGLEL